MFWNEKSYHSLDYEMKKQYGHKVYKLALEAGMTCPNRDGTLGSKGCIFCSTKGSGDFAETKHCHCSITEQIEASKQRVEGKMTGKNGTYIAYFQSFTNTYAPISYLRDVFTEAIRHPDVEILSIATRPDCLPKDVLLLLQELNQIKPVWVELGLQTIHETTAQYIRRGYPLSIFEHACRDLKKAGLTTIAHVILGLPGENRDMILKTVHYLSHVPPDGIDGVKLHLLHVLKDTDLARDYENGLVPYFTLEEYTDLVIDCIARFPPRTVIHRLTGDAPKQLLLSPMWSSNKKLVLNTLTKRLKERGICQGDRYLI